ncbi:TetR/AcrR family transcriptional regulator [Sneathiella sp. HT1-7]|uniref:TetR/AcrR family transcriptional regulator n=1 Tax=Sneathiella sp. HT1-7 TaxID=2887192 RepID=UPI001D14A5E8|nr:TetR family transcriptional regulator [Sneathiella sp. HT1-7]MCC3304013.1 TetR family transcriptional regulator [Sneathiella sp. HT1-7]
MTNRNILEKRAIDSPDAIGEPSPPLDGTKLRIVTAAERLFALHGIDGVTLQQILKGAGQRNSSAMHYHFGTRDALIEAILMWRVTKIDTHRNQMIDNLLAEGRGNDIRGIVETAVIPFIRPIEESVQPSYYNRFLLEVHRSPTVSFDDIIAGKADRGIKRMNELLLGQLENIPAELRMTRIATLRSMLIFAVADIEAVRSRKLKEKGEFNFDRAVENLIDMASAAFIAPMSLETRKQLTLSP